MANPEHLEILKRGVKEWNEWRAENIDVRPDLSEENLDGAKLSGADLSFTDLGGATLIGANLIEVCLGGADLLPSWSSIRLKRGAASTLTSGRTWPRKCASISSPISPTGKSTTLSRRHLRDCSAI
jgi:hypothetical protein